jgi:uncharacterized protein
MAASIFLNERLLLDTSFLIALAVPADQLHGKAVDLAREIKAQRAQLVTTRAVLLELGNSLSKQQHRKTGSELLQQIEADQAVTIEPLSENRYAQALALYVARTDKEWGLVDCLSFELMRELSITKALTADEHFEQAGFHALLRG